MVKKLVIMLVAFIPLLLIGCSAKDNCNELKFSIDWKYNELIHYQVLLNEDGTEDESVIKEASAHQYGASSILDDYYVWTCGVCGYEKKELMSEHEHIYAYAWDYDENGHYHQATCHDEKSDEEEHDLSEWETVVSATVYKEGEESRCCKVCGYSETRETKRIDVNRINMLKKGDTVALLCPASATSASNVTAAVNKIKAYGLNVKTYASATSGSSYSVSYLALSDETRAKEINECFADPEIKGIICMRGGYGSSRTLDLLDYDVIKANPKFFVGYSDITALINAFYFKCGFISYQGFMGVTLTSSNLDAITKADIESVLFEYQEGHTYNYGKYISKSNETVEGTLIGGNLSLFVHLLGSEYLPDCKDKIVFLEDTGEATYSLDRMFTKLRLFHVFDDAKAIVIGYLTNSSEKAQIEAMVKRIFGDLDIPVLYGFPSGHEFPIISLPIGAKVEVSPNGLKILDEVYNK